MEEGRAAPEGVHLHRTGIDELVASRTYITPPGGEIVVDSPETFDYPVESATTEEMKGLHEALDRVLEAERSDSGRALRFRERLVEALESSDPSSDVDKIVRETPIDEPPVAS